MKDADGIATDNSLVDGSNQAGRITNAAASPFGSPDQKFVSVDTQAQVGGGSEASASLLKGETLSKKSFALQDKVKLWYGNLKYLIVDSPYCTRKAVKAFIFYVKLLFCK